MNHLRLISYDNLLAILILTMVLAVHISSSPILFLSLRVLPRDTIASPSLKAENTAPYFHALLSHSFLYALEQRANRDG